jgi:hypothetical protein
MRAPNEQQRQKSVSQEIDEIVEAAAIEAGQDFLDADPAREGAVGGVDERGVATTMSKKARRNASSPLWTSNTAMAAAATRPSAV